MTKKSRKIEKVFYTPKIGDFPIAIEGANVDIFGD